MILFVCAANTCRSPMAAALARLHGADAESAGLFAPEGAPASPKAIRAAAEYGADLSSHRSRPVTEELMARTETVYAMTEDLARMLKAQFPAYAGRVKDLWPPISDPYGRGDSAYAECARWILDALKDAEII